MTLLPFRTHLGQQKLDEWEGFVVEVKGACFLFTIAHTLANVSAVPIDPITTMGKVLHRFSENAFKVSLPNGKEIIGHPAKALEDRKEEILPGTIVFLEMTPFDFEKGRIVDFK
jgi:translation initiation factor IF-1